jgi:hypothetical protein
LPRFVDNREGYCTFTVAACQILATLAAACGKKQIVRIEKDQNGIERERPDTVRRCDLTLVRFAENGFDPVPLAQ